jgi:hypothetical protein
LKEGFLESTGDINEPGYQGKKTTKYILIQETAYPEKTTDLTTRSTGQSIFRTPNLKRPEMEHPHQQCVLKS